MVFVIGSVYVIDYVYLFAYVEPTLHPRDEAELIVASKLLDVLLDLVCQYLIEDFYIDVHQGYWPKIFFVSLFFFFVRQSLTLSLGWSAAALSRLPAISASQVQVIHLPLSP